MERFLWGRLLMFVGWKTSKKIHILDLETLSQLQSINIFPENIKNKYSEYLW